MDIRRFPDTMLGAVCGDIAGSRYEFHNIKYRLKENELIDGYCRFTDDTVMTCAVAEGLVNGFHRLLQQDGRREEEAILLQKIKKVMQFFGRKYPHAGCIAEVIYPIPEDLKRRTLEKLDSLLQHTLQRAVDDLIADTSGTGC